MATLDLGRLRRLTGALEASASAEASADLVASYSRLRAELVDAIGDEHTAELERLFPAHLESEGRPWGSQSDEVKLRFAQMAGWLKDVLVQAGSVPPGDDF